MFNQLQNKIQKFFGISRTEANGFTILFVCVIVLIISPLIYRQYGKGGYDNYHQDIILLDSIVQSIRMAEDQVKKVDSSGTKPEDHLVIFNPNQISYQDMIFMGFDSIIAKRIVSYRNKGGKFKYREDLLKIYDFPLAFYEKINSFIDLPGYIRNSRESDEGVGRELKIYPTKKIEEQEILFDLNRVDSTQLVLIQGIGPVFSKRIIKYREMLGGYTNINQLDEVYGLPDETLLNLKKAVFIDSLFVPDKIKINFVEWRELVKHPYIKSDLANQILKSRLVSGPFIDEDDFQKRLILPDSVKNQLISYIQF